MMQIKLWALWLKLRSRSNRESSLHLTQSSSWAVRCWYYAANNDNDCNYVIKVRWSVLSSLHSDPSPSHHQQYWKWNLKTKKRFNSTGNEKKIYISHFLVALLNFVIFFPFFRRRVLCWIYFSLMKSESNTSNEWV